MSNLADVGVVAVGAFVGTNIDDFVVLLLLTVALPADTVRRWQIVAGQYLGFCTLLVLSGISAAALRSVPEYWVGLLGIAPLALGARGFVRAIRDPQAMDKAPMPAGSVATVAIVTVANGSDNISVYVPLLRHLHLASIIVTVTIFLLLLGIWCAAALVVGRHAQLIPVVLQASRWLTPSVFVIIGVIVLVSTGALGRLAGVI